jgi:glycosyltransferase involved in cell wall biosynthesis
MAASPLRVAFYGGMANNCYMACKSMRALGVDAFFVRDQLDNYAMSQPLWEDHRFSLGYDEVLATNSWTPADWDALADKLGWHAPHWIVDPDQLQDRAEPDFSATPHVNLRNYTPAPGANYREVIAFFQTCDLLFVSNVHAVILASLARRPYVICPAGGEFLMATGQIEAGDQNARYVYQQQRDLLLSAFRRSRAVLTNTSYWHHAALTGGALSLVWNFPQSRFRRVSLPFSAQQAPDGDSKRKALDGLLAEVGRDPVTQRFSVLVPSRVDFRWKGQDRLMAAIDMVPESREFCFIFTGWGADYQKLLDWKGGRENIRILDHALSKPLLGEFNRASDLVIDQFTLGHIGTAAREAVAAGTPVMASIHETWFSRRFGRPELPVLNASSAEEIAQWLSAVATGRCDLAKAAKAGTEWIAEYASPQAMLTALKAAAAI